MDVMAFVRAALKVIGGWRAAAFLLAAVLATGYGTVKSMQVWHLQAQLAASERDAAQASAYAAEQTTKASEAARKEEQARARYIAGIDAAYQQGLRDAQRKADAVAADLRTGSLRFKRLWEECAADAPGGLPGASPDPGRADGVSEGRADSTGRIVRAVESDAAQIRCLQALALTDRGLDPGDLSKSCPEVSP